MKKLLILLCLISGVAISKAEEIKKSDLRVLYVGGSANADRYSVKTDDPAYQKSVEERMKSFKEMLEQYFTSVKVINASDYTSALSEEYDVTVMDGTPKAILPKLVEKDDKGEVTKYLLPGYYPEDYSCPTVTIGELGEVLGRRIGLKTDWYCLCLDADAHHFRKEHPIFNGPFPVSMTVRMKPTPSDAYHYACYVDGPIPDSIPMWKVQTKGYVTDRGFRVGMVARPWGFEDSPDAEYISSGVCAKTLDAVAIGRHANFLHWGFAASPMDMTEEAKTVLANAIVYISKFAGQRPIARKYNDRIATREYLKELKELSTRAAWEERLKANEEFNKQQLKEQKAAQAKQARGEKLNDNEEAMLNYEPQKPISFEDFVKRYQKKAFERFGTDEAAYAAYYDGNKDYFYGGDGMYNLVVDEDVKSLGIPNNKPELLDAAIRLLEKGKDTEKAYRILNRYTLCRFTTPAEWRNWYEANKERLFFTEAGGWLFLVNTREPVAGNDYHVRDAKADAPNLPQTEATNDRNPVQVGMSLAKMNNGNREIVIKVKIHPGYHIYANVAKSDPFVTTTIDIQLPKGYREVGKLKKSPFKSFNQNGTTVYEDEAIFRQEIAGEGSGEISCTIGYQCCDAHICMPPTEKQCVVKVE